MLVEETSKSWKALGKIHYGVTENEKSSAKFRRSIYVVEDVREGEKFTVKNLRIIRPGNGLSPKYYDSLLEKKTVCKIERGTPMSWKLVNQ